ncbi:RsmB/NOP family class I SAM-dependent RNA methyltransferase [Alicyclobacillus fastidiosus]|uniref:RsmB/NOP family class I SAM-dependent RNA methyltransferase n=1 Tax=Alicyclobacillus fastidiosus TaxID=392011 RepID=A0ABY6ZLK0_9BACL|nr:NOL1/NOP2/sun family putative RNA methylase [Alicyclobacillus fastidiosus]WAH43690.1 RsmB/NOP family class I SAM-dependent RNA methyltransferase [Alicyclobacillus fastidiosus]GMA59897.1 23S rRNA methyltransferase [Alicyclobacillus fastidiosus]
MQLPNAFVDMMKPHLGPAWPEFEASYDRPPSRGVRIDRWSVRADDPSRPPILHAVLRHLRGQVPWMPFGFYMDEESVLGKTIYHEAGAFYIQEPSAMAVALAVDPQPGERILDLCAAPGGKSTAIARLMNNLGHLVANEIHPTRVKILAENLERMGAAAAVTNESPGALAKAWPASFHAILVDAPCSGEGMFRKDPQAAKEWSKDSPIVCATRQKDILSSAVEMLLPGGRLIYSTCTFNPMENEQIVAWMEDELGLVVEELPNLPRWSPGRPDFADGRIALTKTRRLWPHLAEGEGHFVARLRKPGAATSVSDSSLDSGRRARAGRERRGEGRSVGLRGTGFKDWQNWLAEICKRPDPSIETPILHKDIYFSDELLGLSVDGIRVLRPGTPLAKREGNRIEPLHGLALRSSPNRFFNVKPLDEQAAIRYMAGDALANDDGLRGFVALEHAGLCLGFAKAVPGRVNNLYPKGWRKQGLISLST